MLYKLKSPIVGIERSDAGMHITQIASGATLKFADASRESGIVEIEYRDRRVGVFVQDLRERSEQVSGEGV
jgi:hypothetical protein